MTAESLAVCHPTHALLPVCHPPPKLSCQFVTTPTPHKLSCHNSSPDWTQLLLLGHLGPGARPLLCQRCHCPLLTRHTLGPGLCFLRSSGCGWGGRGFPTFLGATLCQCIAGASVPEVEGGRTDGKGEGKRERSKGGRPSSDRG